ncbi:hypothetical protein PV318_03125 [Streptomyces sp. ME02-6991-2B]|nr:hypothetical protein [Streptomyces sp. ME02-6991-2B]
MSQAIPREQALANARRFVDQARRERDADRAAGRLAPEREAILRRLEQQAPAAAYRAAA